MENFTLKSLFIYDSTLQSVKKKPSDEEIQEAKLLFYFPNNEDKVIKKSNMGIVEGTISFMDAFEKTDDNDKFLLVEMTKFYYIANTFDENKSIGMILQKTNALEFSAHQNIETKKKWLNILLRNFYELLLMYHGPLHELFFKNKQDVRDNEKNYNLLCEVLNDFIENYFEILPSSRIPFLDNLLYFPLNESSHSQLLLSTQRLMEKIHDIKYMSIMYRGYLLHNEIPLEYISLIYNSLFNNLDASPKYFNFSRPSYKVVQTVNYGVDNEGELPQTVSNFRKCFELIGHSNFLIGINRININNFHVFIPTLYFKSTNEKLKLVVFFQNGLMLFLFLNENFNPQNKVNSLIKLERWSKRYFDEEIPGLENLYTQKSAKFDTITFAYVNYSNKSLKLSSTFFNKKSKLVEKEKLDLLMNIFRIDFDINYSSLTKIRGFYVYYLVTCERKVVIFLPENLNFSSIKNSIEEIKKDLFDYIFIL